MRTYSQYYHGLNKNSKKAYCDFVVWTKDKTVTTTTWPDKNFIKDAITLVNAFFKNGFCLNCWYSRLPPPKAVAHHDNMTSSHHLPTSCELLSQPTDCNDNFEGESLCFFVERKRMGR